MRNPYLTTDASMATNVEDKADKRPPEIQKQVKKKQQTTTTKKTPNGLHIVVKILSR